TPSRSGIAFAYSPALIAFTAAVYWGSSGLAGGLLAPAPPPPPAAPAMPDSPSVSTAARPPWSANRRSNVSMSSPSRRANRGAPAMVPRTQRLTRGVTAPRGSPALRTAGTLVYAAASTATAVALALPSASPEVTMPETVAWPDGARCAIMMTFDLDGESPWIHRDPALAD